MDPRAVRFGDFQLDEAHGLRRNGLIVELHARPLRLLLHLT